MQRVGATQERKAHFPKTEVNFAGTEAFRRKWGEVEAEHQQRRFEIASWMKSAREDAAKKEGVVATKVAVMERQDDSTPNGIVLGTAVFLVGVLLGAVAVRYLWSSK